MNKTIERLIGKDVTVTLCSTIVAPVKGKLMECDELFLVVEEEKGEVVVPLTSVLHLGATPVRAGKR
jgi:hypothetical protein